MVDTEMILEALNSLKTDVNARFDKIDSEIGSMKSDIGSMKTEMSSMKSDIDTMKGDITTMKGEITDMKGDIKKVNEKVTRLEIIIENDIKPDIKKLSEHQLGLREQLEEYKAQVDDRLGTSDLVNLLADYSKKHC